MKIKPPHLHTARFFLKGPRLPGHQVGWRKNSIEIPCWVVRPKVEPFWEPEQRIPDPVLQPSGF